MNRPSRFLEDIPPHLLTGAGICQGEDSQITRAMYSWNKTHVTGAPGLELKDGDRVRHAQFGEGVVVSCQPMKDDAEVVVVFKETGIKKLSLNFAHLEKVD